MKKFSHGDSAAAAVKTRHAAFLWSFDKQCIAVQELTDPRAHATSFSLFLLTPTVVT